MEPNVPLLIGLVAGFWAGVWVGRSDWPHPR
jgi:hypothetical protein